MLVRRYPQPGRCNLGDHAAEQRSGEGGRGTIDGSLCTAAPLRTSFQGAYQIVSLWALIGSWSILVK